MPTERMEEVEVVCDKCHGEGRQRLWSPMSGGPVTINCQLCSGLMKVTRLAPSGSLTAARLRLADAAEAYLDGRGLMDYRWSRVVAANKEVAALRTARGNNKGTNDD